MTSQSPSGEEATEAYESAWKSLLHLVLNEGASFSGREQNRVYLNLEGERFADVSFVSSVDFRGDGRALATLDWDDDGRLDLLLRNRTAPRLRLLRNQDEGAGSFVTVDLVGRLANRDAIGARVILELDDGKMLRRTLYAGDGYLAQSSKRLHFGVGQARTISILRVRWPDGSEDWFGDLAVDRRYRILQGAQRPRVVDAQPAPAITAANAVFAEPIESGVSRIPLAEKLPLSPLPIPSDAAPTRTVADLAGSPVLLNLWGTTCRSCLVELAEFQQHRAELDAAGLRIVPLGTDPAEHQEAARARIDGFGFGADAGEASEDFLVALEAVLREVTGGHFGTPLPTSLLLDRSGNLVAVYRGAVAVDVLLADVAALREMDPEKSSDTRLLRGVRLVAEERDLLQLAGYLRSAGALELSGWYQERGVLGR